MVIPWNTAFSICQHFFRLRFEWLISLDFSRFLQISLVSFGCPWIITLLKSIHIPQYFCDLSILIDLSIDFIDLLIRFSMINFDRFVMPCYKNSRPWKMIPCSSALTHFLVFLSNPQLTNTSEYEWVPIAIGEGGEYKIQYGAQFSAGPSFWSLFVQRLFFEPKWFWIKSNCFQR